MFILCVVGSAKVIVTSDGGFRGEKTIKTKEVVDKASTAIY